MKQHWKPGNMLYPVPPVMVSCARKGDRPNIFTAAWTGTVCTNPPMVSVSIRPERYSYTIIKETGEFVINLTTEKLARATDYCGVKSGRNVDKFKECHLTEQKSVHVSPPGIEESPVSIECKVRQVISLGSHDLFLADVVGVNIEEDLLDEKGTFQLNKSGLITYSHGEYYLLGKKLGIFGYSVQKPARKRKK